MGECSAASNLTQVFGAGTLSYRVWLEHTANTDSTHHLLASWIDGYLTARNEAFLDAGKPATVGHTTDIDSRDAWVTDYCQSHPLAILYVAAQALVEELEKTGR
jgi:hypothetical protein